MTSMDTVACDLAGATPVGVHRNEHNNHLAYEVPCIARNDQGPGSNTHATPGNLFKDTAHRESDPVLYCGVIDVELAHGCNAQRNLF